MKKEAMIYAVKDSLILLLIGGGIAFGVYMFVLNSYGYTNAEYSLLISIVVLTIFGTNILSALGSSMLFDSTYHINKEKNSIGIVFLNEEKSSSTFHLIKVLFYSMIGIIFYPIAFIVALLNLKELFKKDEVYEKKVKEDKLAKQKADDMDINVRGKKKWKIKRGVGEDYYFHTSDEALDYAINKKINTKYVQKVI